MESEKLPLISVITPIYKVENYIEECLRSLFTQSMVEGVEFILINDATPDSSLDIAKRISSYYPNINVKIIDLERNSGIGVVRQRGLDESRGEYVIYVDSDDWCEAQMLERICNFALDSGSDIVVSDYLFCEGDSVKYVEQKCVEDGSDAVKMVLSGQLHGSLWNKLIKRSLYIENGISFRAGLNMMEDEAVVTKLFFFANRIAYLPESFVHYRQHSNSIVSNLSPLQIENMIDYITGFEEFLLSMGRFGEFERSLAYKKIYIKLLALSYSGKNREKFLKLFPGVTKFVLSHPKLTVIEKIKVIVLSQKLGLMLYSMFKRGGC